MDAVPLRAARQPEADAGQVSNVLPVITIAPVVFMVKRVPKGRMTADSDGDGITMIEAMAIATAETRERTTGADKRRTRRSFQEKLRFVSTHATPA